MEKQPLACVLFNFDGRITRFTFWKHWLGLIAGSLVIWVLLRLAMLSGAEAVATAMVALYAVYGLLAFVAILALSTKRWHDRNQSGRWNLILLIPIVGPVCWFVVVGCLRGTWGDNKYGPGVFYVVD